ncbi:hypothetical protein OIK_03212 [Enterococcus faecium EnGen0027]|nr:hypothetical protein OIK_03212 [Enterococcus faecium EnGen0027]
MFRLKYQQQYVELTTYPKTSLTNDHPFTILTIIVSFYAKKLKV